MALPLIEARTVLSGCHLETTPKGGGKVLRLANPTPQPLTAWHALDPEIVYARLAGGSRQLAVESATSDWRRRLDRALGAFSRHTRLTNPVVREWFGGRSFLVRATPAL